MRIGQKHDLLAESILPVMRANLRFERIRRARHRRRCRSARLRRRGRRCSGGGSRLRRGQRSRGFGRARGRRRACALLQRRGCCGERIGGTLRGSRSSTRRRGGRRARRRRIALRRVEIAQIPALAARSRTESVQQRIAVG